MERQQRAPGANASALIQSAESIQHGRILELPPQKFGEPLRGPVTGHADQNLRGHLLREARGRDHKVDRLVANRIAGVQEPIRHPSNPLHQVADRHLGESRTCPSESLQEPRSAKDEVEIPT